MTSSRPRRVLFVINDLRRAGAETQLVRLAAGLDRRRYEPRVVLLKQQNEFACELEEAGIVVEALNRRGPWDLDLVRRLGRAITSFDPDIVHSFLFLANLLSVVATRVVQVPALVLSQRSCYDSTLPGFWRWIARRSHRFADRVAVNSQAALEEERAAGVPEGLLVHIPNGITVPVSPCQVNREALGIPDGPLVVCVAQLSPEKGHQYLLGAWREVVARFPDARLALVGDGPLRGALESQARQLGIAERVVFAGFADPTPWFAAADVAALASVTEGLPNAVMEAMAIGRPVVATRAGGLPELVDDGATGVLVPPANPAALSGALSELLDDPPRCASLGHAGRARVIERFTTERMVSATEAVYGALPARLRGK